MTAKDKIMKARINLILTQPFFGSLIMKLNIIEDSSCPTAWTDGKSMGYNPKWIDSLTLDETTGVTAHEVLHCVYDHIGRRNGRNARQWNKACDYQINLVLLSIRDKDGHKVFRLPEGGLVDDQYADLSSDVIHTMLPKEEDEGGKDGKEGDDPGNSGEVRDSEDSTATADDWKTATQQAANTAKNQGNFSGELEKLVHELLNPKVDWKQLLRRFVEQSAKSDYSWTAPNRRYVAHGIYLPSLKSDMLDLVIGIDISTSVTQEELNQFLTEIKVIGREFKANITAMSCNTSVQSVETFNEYDELDVKIERGGGTRFSPVFEKVAELGLTPKCLVYLTDLECSDFGDTPDYPVLWISTGSKYANKVPFGDVVSIKNKF